MTMTITGTMVDNTVTGTITSITVSGTMVDNTVTGTINEE